MIRVATEINFRMPRMLRGLIGRAVPPEALVRRGESIDDGGNGSFSAALTLGSDRGVKTHPAGVVR